MQTFLVAVDLNKVKNYAALYQVLQANNAVPLQDSLWALAAYSDAQSIFNSIRAALDHDDSLIVAQMGEYAATNLKTDPKAAETRLIQALRAFILRKASR